jgi:hypothetical protein
MKRVTPEGDNSYFWEKDGWTRGHSCLELVGPAHFHKVDRVSCPQKKGFNGFEVVFPSYVILVGNEKHLFSLV